MLMKTKRPEFVSRRKRRGMRRRINGEPKRACLNPSPKAFGKSVRKVLMMSVVPQSAVMMKTRVAMTMIIRRTNLHRRRNSRCPKNNRFQMYDDVV